MTFWALFAFAVCVLSFLVGILVGHAIRVFDVDPPPNPEHPVFGGHR